MKRFIFMYKTKTTGARLFREEIFAEDIEKANTKWKEELDKHPDWIDVTEMFVS